MGNTTSHTPNPNKQSNTGSSSHIPVTRSRPLGIKSKKRSIVDHPPLAPVHAQPPTPSNPIPIPVLPGQPLNSRPTPPQNIDSHDYVPELLSQHLDQTTLNPLQYRNSTRSFGVVRRGDQVPQYLPIIEEPIQDIVRSSIPLRLPQAEHPPDTHPHDGVEEAEEYNGLVPVAITWKGNGSEEVFLAGTFHELEWRTRERLRFDPMSGLHVITLRLHAGTYRIKFIVDDAWRCSPDMPTATDDKTGNLVNYIDVEDSSALDLGNDERQGQDGRVMKANRRRTYPRRLQTTNLTKGQISPNNKSPQSISGRAYHPPLLPPSDSFWGSDSSQGGWEHGRDGVLEKWTNVIPPSLIAAAQQEEAYINAVQAAKDARRGGAGTRGGGTVGRLGMGLPSIPGAPRLPRHLDKVILNARNSEKSAGSGSKSRSGRKRGGSSTAMGMTNLLAPEMSRGGIAGTGANLSSRVNLGLGVNDGPSMSKSASTTAMEQWASADDTSVLPVPSHVVLHHLGTSAIKNGVLAVSDTTRYNKKYITTIYYKPT